MKFLLEYNLPLEIVEFDEEFPLITAMKENNESMIMAVFNAGANANILSQDKETIISIAVQKNNEKVKSIILVDV